MNHQCLKCHKDVDLPEGHRLIVCPACGAAQDALKALTMQAAVIHATEVIAQPTMAKEARTATCSACGGTVSKTAISCPHCGQAHPAQPIASVTHPAPLKSKKGFRAWALVFVIGIVVWFLWSLSSPSYKSYAQKSAQNQAEVVNTTPGLAEARSSLKELTVHTDALIRELQHMQYSAHTDLPALEQRMQIIINGADALHVPNCATLVKQHMMRSMYLAKGAVSLNFAAGMGMNHSEVVKLINLSAESAADARAAIGQMRC